VPEPVIARISRIGKKFEIYVYPEKAYQFREGKEVDVRNILAVENVFTDARKALKAPSSDLKKAFGTTDLYEIARIIGARALQISMGAPILIKIENIEKKSFIEIAEEELKRGVLPISVIRVYPEKREKW